MKIFQILRVLLIICCHSLKCTSTEQRRAERSLYAGKFVVPTNEARLVVSITSYFRGIVQYCSGTLLTDRVVLTAAHCMYRTDSGLADRVNVKNEGWSYFAREYVMRKDFITLPLEKSICADMALIILPTAVPGFGGPFGIKFQKLNPIDLLKEGRHAEIFALGYGITEFNHVSLVPRKVPMQIVSADAQCSLNFLFSHSAISCSGDSGGPVLFYPKNTTGKTNAFNKIPVFLGLSSQIIIYEDEEEFIGFPLLRRTKRTPLPTPASSAAAAMQEEIDDCKRAKELSILQTFHIQRWLRMLARNEKDKIRQKMFADALNSLVGQ